MEVIGEGRWEVNEYHIRFQNLSDGLFIITIQRNCLNFSSVNLKRLGVATYSHGIVAGVGQRSHLRCTLQP
jgi:hypothetical protein